MKKKVRNIILIIVISIISLTSLTRTSANTENIWHKGVKYQYSYSITEYYISPHIEIASDSYLDLYVSFKKIDNADSNIKMAIEIRDELGIPITSVPAMVGNVNYPNEDICHISTYVESGEKIQVWCFIDSIDNPPGFRRQAQINISAFLS